MSYLYRVVILAYPEGAMIPTDYDPDESHPDYSWKPEGWVPAGNYVEILGTSDFIWPVTNKTYRSRSSAVKRQKLIESYGATAIVQRSSRIDWPADGEATIQAPTLEPTVHLLEGPGISVRVVTS